MYIIETHAHTQNVSPCGRVKARKLVQLYKKNNYDAVVITDHYYRKYFDKLDGLNWYQKINCYLSGYREALIAGSEVHLDVLLGIEIMFEEDENEYLVYGIDEKFLCENENLFKLNIEKFVELIKEKDFLIFQAHPFRANARRVDIKLIDGVEVYNGNPRHNSNNQLAYNFAVENNLKMISGSDFHQIEDLGKGGIILQQKANTTKLLVDALKNGNISQLITQF